MLIIVDSLLLIIFLIVASIILRNTIIASIVAIFSLGILILSHIYSSYILLFTLPLIIYIGPDIRLMYLLFLFAILLVNYLIERLTKARNKYRTKSIAYEQKISKMIMDEKNLELYLEEAKKNARLEAKNNVSQRIHDLVGHSLSGALLQVEVAKKMVERGLDSGKEGEKVEELLASSSDIIREGIDEIRKVLKENKPDSKEIGLLAIRSYLNNWSKKFGITKSFVLDGDPDRLSSVHWKAIQNNIVEASNNVVKHSNATDIKVSIDIFNKIVTMRFSDNGKSPGHIEKGMGLKGMEERVAFLNGKLLIDTSKGFAITTILPLDLNMDSKYDS